MAITREKKASIIEKLKGIVSKAKTLVFVNFHGLNVADTTNLRKQLKGAGVGYVVAKKTLIKKALEGISTEGELPALDGEIAVAYGEGDILAPAREVYGFHRTRPDFIKIVGGLFEGKYLGKEAMLSIATIPSREVLIAQFVNLINSPISRFAVVLDQIAKKKETAN